MDNLRGWALEMDTRDENNNYRCEYLQSDTRYSGKGTYIHQPDMKDLCKTLSLGTSMGSASE